LITMHGSAHQGDVKPGTGAFDQAAGMQVIGAIGHHRMALQQVHGIVGIQETGVGQQVDAIGQADGTLHRRTHFQTTYVRPTIQGLASKVGRFHCITIDQGNAFNGQAVQ
jgi:hypothetical protein